MSDLAKILIQEEMNKPIQQPQIHVAAPMNDAQLVCMVAAQLADKLPVKEAAEKAVKLVAECIYQCQQNGLQKAMNRVVKREQTNGQPE